MLLGRDSMLSPDRLLALAALGLGDRTMLVDAASPGTRGRRVIDLPRSRHAARGERRLYRNILLTKGVVAPEEST